MTTTEEMDPVGEFKRLFLSMPTDSQLRFLRALPETDPVFMSDEAHRQEVQSLCDAIERKSQKATA